MDELVAGAVERQNESLRLRCSCHEALGHESPESCEASSDWIADDKVDCVTEAYSLDSEASRASLECGAQLAVLDCKSAKLDCSVADLGLSECEALAADAMCPQLPKAVERAFQDCFVDD